MNDFEQKVIEAEQQCKSLFRRVEALEKLQTEIYKQNEHLAQLIVELKHLTLTISDHEDRLACIEKKPSDMLRVIVTTLITSVMGGGIGIIIGTVVR